MGVGEILFTVSVIAGAMPRLVAGMTAFKYHRDRQQKEQHRHGVFPLRDPGHRFHVHRMHGEDHGREKSAGNGQLPQNDPNQQ